MSDYNYLARGIGPALQEGAQARYVGAHAQQLVDQDQGTKAAAPFLAAALKGDQNAITQLAQTAPHLLPHIYPALARMDAAKQAHLEKVTGWVGDTAGAILDAPEAEQGGLYAAHLARARAMGIPGVENWPQAWGPDAKNMTTLDRAHAKNIREWLAPKKASKAGGGGGGPDLEPMAGAGAPGVSPTGTMMADAEPSAPINAMADAAPPPAAPVVAQAAPPPGPSGPPMIADAGPAPIGGAAPPNAGGLGAGEPPEAPPVQMAQAAPNAPPGIGSGLAPPAAALEKPPAADAGKGVIWPTDPSLQGGVMMGHRAKPGQPLMPAEVGGHFIYKLPDGKTVLYKPTPQTTPEDKLIDVLGPDGATIVGQRNPRTNAYHPINAKPPASPDIPPEMVDVHGDEFLDYLKGRSPEKANIVRSVLAQKPGFLPSDLSKRSDFNNLMGLVLQAQPDYDPTTGGQLRQFRMHNLLNGDEAKTLSAANTALSHAKIFRDLTEAMQNGDTRMVNTIVNEAKKQFGDANVPSAEIARDLYGEELVKAVKGGGQLNEAQEQQMRKNLSINAGPKATQGVINTLTDLMQGRVHTVEDTARKFGETEGNIKNYLSPRSREALDYLKNNPLGASKATAPINPAAIEKLKANPGTAAQFDEVFGQGAAAKALGK